MKKILLVTDAWAPQVNGVVRVQDAQISYLKAHGYEVIVIEPGQFKTIPTPMYPEIRLALFARRRVAQIIEELQPDAIHDVVPHASPTIRENIFARVPAPHSCSITAIPFYGDSHDGLYGKSKEGIRINRF